MLTKYVIIHGSYGSPTENWFPWLAKNLRDTDHEVVLPVFPTPEGQTLFNWLTEFTRQVGSLDRDTVLIGHSLGVAFILSLLEKTLDPVKGCFLVSGFLGNLDIPQFDQVNSTFMAQQFDWETILRNCGLVKVYNSDNDPYVPLKKGQELADMLKVSLTVIKDSGHINADAGFTEFSQLLSDINIVTP